MLVEIYLVNNLQANILINVNVLASQLIMLDFERHLLQINSCNILTLINIVNRRNSYVRRTICTKKALTISPRILLQIFVIYYDNLSNNRDFLFKS